MLERHRLESLRTQLDDEKSQTILDGSLQVLMDADNPIRLTLFASGMRELFTRILHQAAPDDEVRNCSWFEQATDTESITRRQRAIYATQGGLTDEFLGGIGLAIEALHKQAIQAIDTLSKATHVAHIEIEVDTSKIEAFADEAISALEGLLTSFFKARGAVCETLTDGLYDGIMKAFVMQSFDEFDLLAGKGYEVGPFITIDSIQVLELTSRTIKLKVEGVVPVAFFHGKGDDAATLEHEFSFEMTFEAPAENPDALEYQDASIDDSSWYGEGENLEDAPN